jgi:hypothetical protein
MRSNGKLDGKRSSGKRSSGERDNGNRSIEPRWRLSA